MGTTFSQYATTAHSFEIHAKYEHPYNVLWCPAPYVRDLSNLFPLCWVQIENYIKESMKTEMAQLQQTAVHNHTAAMLEMGTNLLSQTAEQTRKLTNVETQVKNARRARALSKALVSNTERVRLVRR